MSSAIPETIVSQFIVSVHEYFGFIIHEYGFEHIHDTQGQFGIFVEFRSRHLETMVVLETKGRVLDVAFRHLNAGQSTSSVHLHDVLSTLAPNITSYRPRGVFQSESEISDGVRELALLVRKYCDSLLRGDEITLQRIFDSST